MFRALAFDNFVPFGEARLDFPLVVNKPPELAEVQLFTGVNGTGKTRLLSVLAAALGNNLPLVKRVKGGHSIHFSVTAKSGAANTDQTWHGFDAGPGNVAWNGFPPRWLSEIPAFAYHGTAYISDASISVMASVPELSREACLSFSRQNEYSRNLLQAIANLKVQAAMDSMGLDKEPKNSRALQIIRAMEKTLSDITDQPLSFTVTSYPEPSLRVKWMNEEMFFDALPDGLRSIIGWMVDAMVMMDAWLQGKGSITDTEAVFLLDEVESHLHPVWQRRVLPAFQRLFPKAQIFVATHSPFVIASLNYGWIHRLKLEKNGKATILQPVAASPGESYISVLEEIMGLEEWYDPETEALLANFRTERDKAYQGNEEAKKEAFRLATKLSERSMELRFTMGKELSQMERQLAKVETK